MIAVGERPRLGNGPRALFLNQLGLTAALVVMLVLVLVITPEHLSDPWLYSGIITFFVASCLAVALRWHELPVAAIILVPVLNIVALGLMRIGVPWGGAGILLAFPLIWLAIHLGRLGVITGSIGAAAVMWAPSISLPKYELPPALLLPVVLTFVSVMSYMSARRAAAHTAVIAQQSVKLAEALTDARRQEAVLHSVLNAVDFGVIGFDNDGNVSFENIAWSRLDAELAGPHGGARLTTDGETPLDPNDAPRMRTIRGEEFDNVRVWVHKENGEVLVMSNSARQIDPDGPRGSVMVARDVTEELRALRVRDDLVASVSHELRTPMTSVLGYLELAQDAPELSDETRMLVGVATRNAQRLLRLIGDMMAASSTSSGQLSMAFTPCDIAEIVTQSAEAHLPASRARGIRLQTRCLEPVPAVGDSLRLRQVVDNLISNAIKYNRDNGAIDVATSADETTAWIMVRDTGIGIQDDEQPLLFERFFRAPSVRSASSGAQGLGLGLGISRDIVRAHGGDITITSVFDEGTTVLVTLPLVPPGSGQSPALSEIDERQDA
jgi:two-component system phosphate regulon sensor histidine kinase PhoR